MARKSKGATPHLRIRIEPEILARLEKSRKARGRTLTGEIVDRVERSFRKEDDADLAVDVFRGAFGGATGDLLRAFATAIWLIERRTGKKWNEDMNTHNQVSRAMDYIMKGLHFHITPNVVVQSMEAAKAADAAETRAFLDEQVSAVSALKAAIETLQKMDLAPSDAEIAEAGKEYAEAGKKYAEAGKPTSEDDGEKK